MDSLFNLLPFDGYIICLIVIGATFLIGLIYTIIVSYKLRSSKSFFITSVMTPMIVASVISMISLFLNDTTSGAVRIATIAVALGLIRFRSASGRAEELLLLFGGVAFGLIAGLGYVVIAMIVGVLIAVLYLLLASFNIFRSHRMMVEKLLKVTVPEDLDYQKEINPVLETNLKKYELVEIKTSGMGSLYKLSYRIEYYNGINEKKLLDEVRTKNANLEVSLLPYVESNKEL